MTSVTFIMANGQTRTVDIPSGRSVMQGAVNAGINGIDALCGGAVVCATCHVYVAKEWIERLPTPSTNEARTLDCTVDPDETSRLSCQILVNDDLDGLVVRVPLTQY
jgi:2Fe-2S ferredoxin